MKHRYLKLNPGLNDYVRTLLLVEGQSDSQSSDLPLFTNGIPALVCEMNGDQDLRITLFGRSVSSEDWITGGAVSRIAYFFKPFALGCVFKLSAQVLKDKPITLCLTNTKLMHELNVPS